MNIQTLQNELLNQRKINTQLPNLGTSAERYPFTEVLGVSVCFGPNGGPILPAVRRYEDASDAA